MEAAAAIKELRGGTELSIIRLTEPIFNAQALNDKDTHNRLSNASSNASDTQHDPVALRSDLQHYRDLFAKLRFSYVEQVTKEKFLRTITEDSPQFVTAEENDVLDEKNKQQKALLAEKKEELQGMLQDLEAQGRELARRYHEIELQTTQLEMVPVEIEELESKISQLDAVKEVPSEDPAMRLSIRETLALLAQRQRESASLDRQIKDTQVLLSQRQYEVQALRQELGPLQLRKDNAIASAKG